MLKSCRRIVTGNDKDGRSEVIIDGPPGQILEADGHGLGEIWLADRLPAEIEPFRDLTSEPLRLDPPPGGARFRYFIVGPEPKNETPEERKARTAANNDAFTLAGASHARVDMSRHPSMHKTETLDFNVVLRGEVSLILDKDETPLKQGDVVVQRATNHAWVNYGDEPALMLSILIDGSSKPAAA